MATVKVTIVETIEERRTYLIPANTADTALAAAKAAATRWITLGEEVTDKTVIVSDREYQVTMPDGEIRAFGTEDVEIPE